MSSPRLRQAPWDRAGVPHKQDAAKPAAQLEIGSFHAVLDLGCRGSRIDSMEVDYLRPGMLPIDAWFSRS